MEGLGGRVTVGDVSSRAGLTLAQTERTLNALAADSEGTLQVSSHPPLVALHPSCQCAALSAALSEHSQHLMSQLLRRHFPWVVPLTGRHGKFD